MGLSLALGLPACGPEVQRGGRAVAKTSASAKVARPIEPTDLFPSDLDLVLRVDVARLRDGLGPTAVEQLRTRALGGADDVVSTVFACAEVVWIATRLADLDHGDRVVVVEGHDCAPAVSLSAWEKSAQPNPEVTVYEHRGPVPRSGTARVLVLGKRAVAFVSPVELDSVRRVLRAGADERRGDPAAEGVVSLDLLARRLPAGLERRFPSIASVIAGLDRVRGTAALVEGGVRIDAEIKGQTQPGADRARRFLEAVRDNALASRYAEAVRGLTIEPLEGNLRLRWVIPAKVVLSLLAGDASEGEPRK